MKTITFPDGEIVPALGQGTSRMGENKNSHADEVAALRLGIDLGMTLIDTAEMYGEAGAEFPHRAEGAPPTSGKSVRSVVPLTG